MQYSVELASYSHATIFPSSEDKKTYLRSKVMSNYKEKSILIDSKYQISPSSRSLSARFITSRTSRPSHAKEKLVLKR